MPKGTDRLSTITLDKALSYCSNKVAYNFAKIQEKQQWYQTILPKSKGKAVWQYFDDLIWESFNFIAWVTVLEQGH